jgi:hypothetical protein
MTSMKRPVDIFHVGPPKTATTWVYQCFREHPEIATSELDSIDYYNVNYHKTYSWYIRHFILNNEHKLLFDPSYNYLRSPFSAKRIARDNPNAKIIICLREPIERAFSHYWHEKKKGRYNFTFDEILSNYDLFANWLEPGFYSFHIERFLKYFPIEQLKIILFDDLKRNPGSCIRDLFLFSGVDADFVPSIVDKKINVAKPKINPLIIKSRRTIKSAVQGLGVYDFAKKTKNALSPLCSKFRFGEPVMESISDVDPEVIDELIQIVENEILKLESLLNINLNGWRKNVFLSDNGVS